MQEIKSSHLLFKKEKWKVLALLMHLEENVARGVPRAHIIRAAVEKLNHAHSKYLLVSEMGAEDLRFYKMYRGKPVKMADFDADLYRNKIEEVQEEKEQKRSVKGGNRDNKHMFGTRFSKPLKDAVSVLYGKYPGISYTDLVELALRLAVEDGWTWDAEEELFN